MTGTRQALSPHAPLAALGYTEGDQPPQWWDHHQQDGEAHALHPYQLTPDDLEELHQLSQRGWRVTVAGSTYSLGATVGIYCTPEGDDQ